MRPNLALSLAALLLVSACSHAPKPSDQPSPPAMTPGPLQSCGIEEVQIDGADVILTANVDASLDTQAIVSAPDDRSRAQAILDLRKIYGDPKPDTRTTYRQWHYGLVQPADMCGRAVNPPSPLPATSPPGSSAPN